jgi:CheY-like chemotaxis protein
MMPDKKASRGPAGKDRPGPLILVVDDFEDNREMYTQFLRFNGYRVAEAVDGLDALTKAAALRPDLIVMDLSLPRLDGWEATRRLKKDPVTAAIPVVALTGHALAGHEDGARSAGCDSFVTKPCIPADLEAEIRRVLTAKSGARRGR